MKTYYVAYRDFFEFKTKYGQEWSSREIMDAYFDLPANDPKVLGKFETPEEAEAVLGKPYSRILENNGSVLLSGECFYVAEEIYDVDDDGEEYFEEAPNVWTFKAQPVGSDE